MLDIALKNVFRQKARSFLTILGIAMGIGLILALGAIGEGLNQQIERSFGNIAGVIDVRATDNDEGISESVIDGIKLIDGVESVVPVGSYSISRGWGRGFVGMGRPPGMMRGGSSMQFTGINPEDLDYLVGEEIIAEEGRKLEESDEGEYVVLLGASSAENQYLNVGDEIEYEKEMDDDTTESFYFYVIGILEETGDDDIDGAAYVPLKTMQDLEEDETITELKVKIANVELVEEIENEISDEFDEVRAMSMLSMVRQMESTLGTITMAVLGIGAIAVIVGGIGIMNTMIMSVMERRREIGVMKAIGATTTMILKQVLQESALLSVIGGGVGLGLGYFATTLITSYTTFTTVITPNLIIIGMGFALILGIGAGLYPAWAASRLDPIEVLRYE